MKASIYPGPVSNKPNSVEIGGEMIELCCFLCNKRYVSTYDGTAHRGRHLDINFGPTLNMTRFKASIIILVSDKPNGVQIRTGKWLCSVPLCFSQLGLYFVRMTAPRVAAVRDTTRVESDSKHTCYEEQWSEQLYLCTVLFCSQRSSEQSRSIHPRCGHLLPCCQAQVYHEWGKVRLLYTNTLPRSWRLDNLECFIATFYDRLYIEPTTHLVYNIHLVGLTI